jgi:hypothetical protein
MIYARSLEMNAGVVAGADGGVASWPMKASLGAAAAFAFLVTATTARAEEPSAVPREIAEAISACVGAFEAAQSDRLHGKLVSARERLPACLPSSCPERLRDDCARMQVDLDRAIPTATFAVRGADGSDLDATLAVDGIPVDLHAGRSQMIDPGMHLLTYTLAGGAPRTSRLAVYEGEKSRFVVVNAGGGVMSPADAGDEKEKKSLVLPLVIGGGGVLLYAASIFFAARAIGSANEVAAIAPTQPAGVAPCQDHSAGKADPKFCEADQDRRASTTVAVVSGIAGTAALGTAIVLAVLSRDKPRASHAARITPSVGPNAAGAAIDLSF